MSDKTDDCEIDPDSNEDRGHLAQDRTIMANERTFNSWVGLGLGVIAVAIGLQAVFGDFEPTWAAKLVASFFILIAIVIFWSAERQAGKTLKRLNDTAADPVSSKNFRLLAILLSIAAVATGVILWGL